MSALAVKRTKRVSGLCALHDTTLGVALPVLEQYILKKQKKLDPSCRKGFKKVKYKTMKIF